MEDSNKPIKSTPAAHHTERLDDQKFSRLHDLLPEQQVMQIQHVGKQINPPEHQK